MKQAIIVAVVLFLCGVHAGICVETPASFGSVSTLEDSIIRIPYMDTSPTMDGLMAPGEWDASTAFSCFWYPAAELSLDPAFLACHLLQPRLHAGYDKENLYFAFISPVYPKESWLKGKGRFHDVWMHPLYGLLSDDHYELELRPYPDYRVGFTKGLFKFIVNPLGSYSDQFWSPEKGEGLDWEVSQYGGQVVSHVSKDEWIVEFKIPFKSMIQGGYKGTDPKTGQPIVPLPPPPGTVFRCWFVRGIGGGGTFWQLFDKHIWNTTITQLIMDPEAPSFQLLNIGNLMVDNVDVVMKARNPTTRSQTVRIGLFVESPEGNIYSSYDAPELSKGLIELRPGETKDIRLRKNLPGVAADGNVLWLDVRSAGTPAKILFRTRLIPFHSMDGGRFELPKGFNKQQLGEPDEDGLYSFERRRLNPIALMRPPRTEFDFVSQFESYHCRLGGFVDVGAPHVKEKVRTAAEAKIMVMTADSDERTIAETVIPFHADFAPFHLDLKGKVSEGESYGVSVLLFDANKRIVGDAGPVEFRYKVEEWMHNNIGKNDVVWEPFVAMKPTEKGFETLKHRFTLDKSGLPAQIFIRWDERELPLELRANGESPSAALLREIGRGDQLRASVRLEAVIAGQHVPAEVVEPAKLVRQWKSELEYHSRLKAGAVEITLRIQYDCDGSMHVSMDYSASTATEVEVFELVTDVFGTVNLKIAATASNGGGMTGAPVWDMTLSDEPGLLWDSSQDDPPQLYYSRMCPYFWFGSGDRGWTYFCDSDQGMILDKTGGQMGLERDKTGEVTWRVKFVNHKATIDRLRTVDFSLLTHPAKPKPANNRRIGWFHNGSVGAGYMHENAPKTHSELLAGKSQVLPDEKMWQGDQRLPMYRYGWWRNCQIGLSKMDVKWEDMATFYFSTFIRKGRRSGWWMDEYFPVSMGRSDNLAMGYAYLRDPATVEQGEVPWQSGFVTSNMRDHYKRIARVHAEENVPLRQITWANNAASLLESFIWDCHLVEECGGWFRSHEVDALTQYPMCLYTYWSRHFSGTVPRLNWDDTQAMAGDSWRGVRQYLGLAMLNDFGVTPQGPHGWIVYPGMAVDLLRELERFGFFNDDMEYIPHWRSKSYIAYGQPIDTDSDSGSAFSTFSAGTVDPLEKVYVSVYRRPLDDGRKGNKALIVLLNASHTDIRERLYVNDTQRVFGGPNRFTAEQAAELRDVSHLKSELKTDWNKGTVRTYLSRSAQYREIYKDKLGREQARLVHPPVLMDIENKSIVPQVPPFELRGDPPGEVYRRVFVPYHEYRILYGEWVTEDK